MLALLLATTLLPPQTSTPSPAPGDLLVANLGDGSVSWFDGVTGRYRGPFVAPGAGGLSGATGLVFSPTGDLLVSSSATDAILAYDGRTGAYKGPFSEPGAVVRPFSLTLGDTGSILVSSEDAVLRLDSRGRIVDTLASAPHLATAVGLRVRPCGTVLVASAGENEIVELGPWGARALLSDGLRFPSDLLDSGGLLWVTRAMAGEIVGFRDGVARTRITLPDGGAPVGLAGRSDGAIFVGDFAKNRLYLLDPRTEQATLVSAEGLEGPENLLIVPDARMRLGGESDASCAAQGVG